MSDHSTMQPRNIRNVKNTLKPSIIENTATVDSDKEDPEANTAGSEFFVHFVPPAMGTPAAAALQANSEVKISRLAKGIRRIRGIKHPKVKNVARRFRQKKDQRFSRNFKGKVIDGVHELYTLTAGMMLGMRYAISRSNHFAIQNLTLGDFGYVEKIEFPPRGNTHGPFRTPPHQLGHTFKFKTYAPLVFSRIRDYFGVDSVNYMLSICGNYNYLEFISNSKSGQFFFYSHDGRYMIKTQTTEENKFMKRILPHYYRYVSEHPHTFLVRIYGMHRVKMYHLQRKVHFVIMSSVFDTPVPINKIYDLKGSLVGRKASAHDRAVGGVLKDNDLVEDKTKLKLGSKRQSFLDQIEKDANFLAGLNIMDYSLLVGIHTRSSREEPQEQLEQEKAGPVVNVDPVSATVHVSHNVRSKTPFRKVDSLSPAKPPGGRSHSVPFGESVDGIHETDPGEMPPANPAMRPRSQSLSLSSTTQRRRSSAGTVGAGKKATARRMSAALTVAEHISSSVTPGEEFSAADMVAKMPTRSAGSEMEVMAATAGTTDTQTPDNASIVSGVSDVGSEDDGDFDIEDDDDADCDLGDSDVDFDGDVLALFLSKRASASDEEDEEDEEEDEEGKIVGTEGDENVRHFHEQNRDVFEKNQQQQEKVNEEGQCAVAATAHDDGVTVEKTDSDRSNFGAGIAGEEGRAVRELFNDDRDLARLSLAAEKEMMINSRKHTFGPGAAMVHPWTARSDKGINSRLENEMRGDEIYYVGIIDILQQYNASKRAETLFKGLIDDRKQISSVDSVSYAKRFVEFMKSNSC